MIRRRPQRSLVVSDTLLAAWPKLRRWVLLFGQWSGRMLRRVDLRKPVHLTVIGLLVGTVIAPVAVHLYENERYHLADSVRAVAERPSPMLMSKLGHDTAKRASVFNAEGAEKLKSEAKDQLQSALGAGGKKDNQLYTATLPDDASRGIEISDNVSGVSFKFVPQMSLMGGRTLGGQVVYPMKGMSGHMIFTPKGNGIKEDIVLDRAPRDDAAEFSYRLEVPKYLEPRLDDDGSIGFYTGTPELFGNISYGSDKDRENVDRARANAKKTYLMFKIPAPTIRETGKTSNVMGRFSLSGSILTVRVTGLAKAHYPIAIDPTFYITSTTDFILGSIDDNIDLSVAGQVGRQALVGGSAHDWNPTSAPNLTYAQFSAGLVAYNGYLYLIGGGCTSGGCTTSSNDVRYICLNPNTGALGTNGGCTPSTWTNTGNGLLNTARQGLVAFGYNGYLYAVGGENTSAVPITAANSVEFAKINSDGTVGTWNYTGHLNTARGYMGGAIYQGVLYALGGSSGTLNATPLATTEYARINGDGTIGSCDNTTYHAACTWTTTTSFTTARNRFRGTAYNGFVYIGGGRTSTPTVLNDLQYAAIQSDGSLGTWQSATSFPTARRDLGMGVNNGYLYVYGGCQQAALACPTNQMLGDTYYAVINADGTIGQWQKTLQYNYNSAGTDFNPRVPGGTTFYSNHLYFIGGCFVEAAATGNHCTSSLVGTFITSIDDVGRFDKGIATTGSPPYSGTSTVARMGAKAVALNGYMYYMGGCSVDGCDTYNGTVEYAAINADGSLGNFATTTALPAGSGNSAGRMGHTLAAYNNKLYVIGGVERTTSGSAGATPTVASNANSGQNNNAEVNHTVALPGGLSAGDLMLVFYTNDGSTTVATPAGWVAVATATRGTNVRGTVFAHKVDGTEGGTQTFVTARGEQWAAVAYGITGWSGDLGGIVAAGVDPGANTANPNPPSLSTTWGTSNTLWFAYAAGSSYSSTTTYPTNYTNGQHQVVSGGNTAGASAAVARRALAAGTEDPGTFTENASQSGVAFTVAVEPALAHSDSYMSTILSNTQNSDGTLSGTWATETNGMTGSCAARAFHTTEVWHNYIYAIGGLDSSGAASGSIYYWQIGSGGALGTCQVASNTIQARWGHSGGIWGEWLYVVGGQSDQIGTYIGTSAGNNAVQRITLGSSGDTTAVSGYAVDTSRRLMGGYVDRGILYTFGGDTVTGVVPDVSRAALDSSTGAPGTFDATNIGTPADNFPTAAVNGIDQARSLTTSVAYGGYAYTMGGCTVALNVSTWKNCGGGYVTTADTSEVDLPNNGGTGQLGAFTTGGSEIANLPTVSGTAGRADHAAVAYNNKLYIVGGCRVYTSGSCTTGLGDIQRADINADGTITSGWTAQTALPGSAVRSGLRAVAYNQHLYVIGGRDSGGTPTNSVWHTTIDNTGTLGASWTSADLPSGQERADFGAAITNGYLYVVGGINASGTRQTSVYLASIDNSTGAVGTWTTTSAFTTARSDFGFSAYNGVLYIVGGYDGSNALTDVQYGDIGGGGSISAWKYTTDVARGARARQAVGANGYMYYLGDEGGSNTNIQYSAINSTGALGTSQTSPTTMSGAHAHGAAVFYNGFVYLTGGCTLSSNVCSTVSAANDKAGQQAISRTGHYSKLFDTQVDTTPTQLVVNGVDGGPGSLVEFKFYTASTGDPVLGVAQLIRPVIYGNFYNVQALNSSGAYVGQAFQYEYVITLDDSRAGTFPDVPKSGSQTAVTDVTLFYHANPARRLRHGASFTNSGCNDTVTIKDGCILDTAP